MKKLVRKIIEYFGYELRKSSRILDAISYNSAESAASFYRDQQLTQHYIQQEVKPVVEQLLQLLSIKKIDLSNKTVLDVGCGTGHFLAAVKDKFPGAEVEGTEFTDAVFPLILKINPGIKLTCLDITKTFLDKTFDAVFCTFVLEHLQQPETALTNLMRMVKPGGLLILTVPDGRTDDFPGHIFFWSQYSWRLLLEKNFSENELDTGFMADGKNLFCIVANIKRATSFDNSSKIKT